MNKKRAKLPAAKRRIVFAVIASIVIIASFCGCALTIYNSMLNAGKESCWKMLEDSAESIEREMNTQIDSNMNVLKIIAGAMVREQRTGETQANTDAILGHLNDYQDLTMFERIDLVFKNGNVLLQTGETLQSAMKFDEVVKRGVHVSGRKIDIVTGEKVICCVVPVIVDDEAVAVLVGVVMCEKLPEILQSTLYDGGAIVCMVDRETGDFIMDDWHDELGNLYQMEMRKTLPGYEGIDVGDEVSQGKTGVLAFESKVNGKASYMFYKPIESRGLAMIVVAQEDVVFKSLNNVKPLLTMLIVLICVLLLLYMVWLVITLIKMMKSEEKTKKRGYTDSMTGLYNHNKFVHDMEECEREQRIGIGLMFMDLNGLKYTNDHFGHDAGNRLLVQIASLLKENFGDNAYRVGGDEFTVLMHSVPEESFRFLCEMTADNFKKNGLEVAMGVTWHLSGAGVKHQLKEADDLMYSDKRSYHEKG